VITCSLSLSHPKFNIGKKHYMKRVMSTKGEGRFVRYSGFQMRRETAQAITCAELD
jgi:hypothetical protein